MANKNKLMETEKGVMTDENCQNPDNLLLFVVPYQDFKFGDHACTCALSHAAIYHSAFGPMSDVITPTYSDSTAISALADVESFRSLRSHKKLNRRNVRSCGEEACAYMDTDIALCARLISIYVAKVAFGIYHMHVYREDVKSSNLGSELQQYFQFGCLPWSSSIQCYTSTLVSYSSLSSSTYLILWTLKGLGTGITMSNLNNSNIPCTTSFFLDWYFRASFCGVI